MENLYFVGVILLAFSFDLLITQGLWYLIEKYFEKKKKHLNGNWYTVLLSFIFIFTNIQSYVVGLAGFIITLIVNLVGIKMKIIIEKHITNWAFGITITIIGLGVSTDVFEMCTYILLGALWIWLTIFNKTNKFWKMSIKTFSATSLLVVGIVVFAIGNYFDKQTAHICTDDVSVKLGRKSATVGGWATPNAKIKTYLDGEEVEPSEKADQDGRFSFEAQVPGKWTVKVTKNGKTAKDTVKVEKSKAWQKYQAKEGAKEAKRDFENSYATALDLLDSLGVDEYNQWAEVNNSGSGGSINSTIEQIQNDNKKDIMSIVAQLSILKSNLKKLQDAGDSDADTYKDYYEDIKKLESTVINPPAGDIDNFGDAFDEQRTTVNTNLDLL